ncbi:amidohydrolase family protein [Chloroflexota bacterium]
MSNIQNMQAKSNNGRIDGRIDIHHHILPEEYVAKLKGIGITTAIGREFPEWSPKKSLDFMKKNGISKAITSISTPGVNHQDCAFAKNIARFCNEYSAKLKSDYPDKFDAFAVLPLYEIEDALEEMEYALDTLHLCGVALLTNVNGIYLGDPKYDDLLAELDRRKVVVHIHPHDPPFGTIPNLKFPNAIIEAPFDTTRAITNMIYNGAMDRYKKIKFILSHAGGALPFLAWRIALLEYQQTKKNLKFPAIYDFLMTKRGPSAGLNALSRLYYDTAVAANPMVLRSVQELVDASHILFGTDYVWGQSWLTPIFIKALKEYDGFNEEDLAAVESGNANKLFS